ncbi:MAG TPA: CoA pyrophosphatase [Anaerolineales bacterium]|nr:CoA pyrophosphatase [Anaerolineales bacterium]
MPISEETISSRLMAALPPNSSQSHAYSEIDITEDTRLKCAAVLIPLVKNDDDWHVLFTRRTHRVESHKGQVSFPGGACDEGETTPEETALREANEEIGVIPTEVRVLGRLASMITISTFRVTPVIGVLPWPCVFRVNEEEVERIFTVPLNWLGQKGNRWEFTFPGRTRGVIVYQPFDGEMVWGATARMTVDFLNVIGL